MTVLERTRKRPFNFVVMPTRYDDRQHDHDPFSEDCQAGKRVSLEDYWQHYYEHGNYNYEYNNGILEVKPMATHIDFEIYNWFLSLLGEYLRNHAIAKVTGLEIGFKMQLPEGEKVRKPDLGIVLHSNPIPLQATDRRYHGIFDVCVESVSDSKRSEMIRDTEEKFEEYEYAQVKEYFLLSRHETVLNFYRLNEHGKYDEIEPNEDGIIRSSALPGFQFRVEDLYRKPSFDEMVSTPIYQGFIWMEYQEERLAKLHAERIVRQERLAKEQAEQLAEKFAELLRQQGIDPDQLS